MTDKKEPHVKLLMTGIRTAAGGLHRFRFQTYKALDRFLFHTVDHVLRQLKSSTLLSTKFIYFPNTFDGLAFVTETQLLQ